MTNKEKIIEIISGGNEKSIIEMTSKVFEIVNKRDWSIFCSYMGDYDHPSERVEAERIFNLEINKLAGELGLTSNDILIDLSNKITNIKLYNESFHKMNEEYKEVE